MAATPTLGLKNTITVNCLTFCLCLKQTQRSNYPMRLRASIWSASHFQANGLRSDTLFQRGINTSDLPLTMKGEIRSYVLEYDLNLWQQMRRFQFG